MEALENQKNDYTPKGMARIAKKKFFIITTVFVLLLLTIATAWLLGSKQGKDKANAEIEELKLLLAEQSEQIKVLIDSPIVVSKVNPEIVVDIIHSELNEISELATMEYLFTDAAKYSDSRQIKNWNVPFTEKAFIIKWDGVIKAGIKLDKLDIDVNESEKKILIHIPSAEILSYQTSSNTAEILYEQDNIFNNITISDKISFDAATENAMKQRAIENGLLEKAQQNAETILRGLLQANPDIGNNYTIEFVTSE